MSEPLCGTESSILAPTCQEPNARAPFSMKQRNAREVAGGICRRRSPQEATTAGPALRDAING